jgi:hypothetical protein
LKVRLDENLSFRVAGAIRAILSNRTGLIVDWVRDEHPPGTDDPSWINKFSQDDGTAILSGDANILQHWPNLIAYIESGLISFFPPPNFDKLRAYGQASLILRWWPSIVEKIKISKRGDCWRIPMSWSPSVENFQSLQDPRFSTKEKCSKLGVRTIGEAHQFRPRDPA